jgi:hypothetical protein
MKGTGCNSIHTAKKMHCMNQGNRNSKSATSFDALPDEIVVTVIAAVAASAVAPADLASASLTYQFFYISQIELNRAANVYVQISSLTFSSDCTGASDSGLLGRAGT